MAVSPSSGKTVLLAWELGSDYGHLHQLLPLALELRARGHRCVFALRDLMGAEAILSPLGFEVMQAPLWLGQVTHLPPSISYAELLMQFGWLHVSNLPGIARAWRPQKAFSNRNGAQHLGCMQRNPDQGLRCA